MKDLQHHIKCGKGDVGRFVLLPGDPARAEMIAGHFDEAKKIAQNREFVTFTGKTKGVPVSVTSTGIGGPSTAIAVEELVRCCADTFIRVGTGGALVYAGPALQAAYRLVGAEHLMFGTDQPFFVLDPEKNIQMLQAEIPEKTELEAIMQNNAAAFFNL